MNSSVNKELLEKETLNTTKATSQSIINVTKASGDQEPFLKEKLENSLFNAGASNAIIQKIVADIEDWITEGITTRKIYSRAFKMLRRQKTNAAMRYKLKQAIMQIGPTGYPFEIFIGELFRRRGYDIEVGVVVDGFSIPHEMDVVATNKKTQNLVECKYHYQGKHVNIQVPLYVHSRVNDIIRKRQPLPQYTGLTFRGWIVTNTRFSTEAISYGSCYGMKLLAWDYPKGNGLKDIIEELRLYPITILTQITRKHKQTLLKSGIVTCRQLYTDHNSMALLKLSQKKQASLKQELEDICS